MKPFARPASLSSLVRSSRWGSQNSVFLTSTSCTSNEWALSRTSLAYFPNVALYHSSSFRLARIVQADTVDVSDGAEEEEVQVENRNRKKSKAEMSPEEWEEVQRQNAQREKETRDVIAQMNPIDFAERLVYLFQTKRPPRLMYFHMLLEKVTNGEELKSAIGLLKWYLSNFVDIKEDTAKLLVQTGIRANALEQVVEVFGTPLRYRIWPTAEMWEIMVDYFLENNDLPGAVATLEAYSHRLDINPSRELFDKVFQVIWKRGAVRSGLALANVTTRAFDLKAWEPEWYEYLFAGYWKLEQPTRVLQLERQREYQGVPRTPAIAGAVAWAHLSQGQAKEAATAVAEFLKAGTTNPINGATLHRIVARSLNNEEKMKAPFEEFAQLLPTMTQSPVASKLPAFWELEVKRRAEMKAKSDAIPEEQKHQARKKFMARKQQEKEERQRLLAIKLEAKKQEDEEKAALHAQEEAQKKQLKEEEAKRKAEEDATKANRPKRTPKKLRGRLTKAQKEEQKAREKAKKAAAAKKGGGQKKKDK